MAVGDRVLGVDSSTGLFAPNIQVIQDARVQSQIDASTAAIPAASPLVGFIVGDGSGTIPVRPTTPNPVLFNTTTFVPTTGTTAGGTRAMVIGLDVWLGAGGGGSGNSPQYVVENPLGSGTYPNRPATALVVEFKGVIPPGGGGSTAGGTPLMVDNLDEWDQYVL